MSHRDEAIVVTDSSVIINFLKINRLDLIEYHSHKYIVTDHVIEEVKAYSKKQVTRFNKALDAGVVEQVSVNKQEELEIFFRLTKTRVLGAGECSAIAFAINNGHTLATDDRRAIEEAINEDNDIQIFTTQNIIVSMIEEGLLDIDEADAIKADWTKNHRFHLKIESFAEFIKVF